MKVIHQVGIAALLGASGVLGYSLPDAQPAATHHACGHAPKECLLQATAERAQITGVNAAQDLGAARAH